MIRTHFIQHVAFENPGYILSWARKNEHDCTFSILTERDPVPVSSDFDLLVVMGGPMSANDDGTLKWMKAEKQLISRCFDEQKPMIGICLGSQIMASVLGSKVYRGREKEIGWFPIRAAADIQQSDFLPHLPSEQMVFHWHGETFDLPSGARLLASTDNCPNQAFEYGGHALGLQFHMEVTPQNVDAMWEVCGEEISEGPFQQVKPALDGKLSYYHSSHNILERALDNLLNAAALGSQKRVANF